MKHRLSVRIAIASIVFLLLLAFAGTSLAQDGTPPPAPTPAPACVADAQTACVKIVFYPAALKADLFLGDQPTAQVQQPALYVTFASPAPGQTLDVVVKNIHDGGADEGLLYQYPDMPKTVSVPYAAGQTTTLTLYPVKKYIRGKIVAKCAPLSVLAGEDVSCLVSVDGVAQTIPAPIPTPAPDGTVPPQAPPSATLAAGQSITFIIDPGPHVVTFELAGDSSILWSPYSVTKSVTVTAGTYAQVATATFQKAGRLTATLEKAENGWVADFYVDGVLMKAQTGSISGWVEGNKSHKVEVRNITNPLWPLLHLFAETSATTYVTSGGSSSVTLKLVPISTYESVDPFDNPDNTAPSSKYIYLRPGWLAASQAIALDNQQRLAVHVSLNGQDLGDLTLYGSQLRQVSNGYSIEWLVPLGKMTPGVYTYQRQWTVISDLFDGWSFYPAGTYYDDLLTFTIVP